LRHAVRDAALHSHILNGGGLFKLRSQKKKPPLWGLIEFDCLTAIFVHERSQPLQLFSADGFGEERHHILDAILDCLQGIERISV